MKKKLIALAVASAIHNQEEPQHKNLWDIERDMNDKREKWLDQARESLFGIKIGPK